ncbi:MAG: acetyl-CoA hydrolase/transferase family protein [Neisseriaceae bacterium]|nr:acetyl-CoA hydrolase/transferase family protein [Neisseriaceae bacterium]
MMTNPNTLYQEKKTTAEEALRLLRDGDSIVVPTGVGEPPALLTALSNHRREFHNIDLWQLLPQRPYEYLDPETVENIHHRSFFVSATVRKGANEGWIDVLPCHFSDIPDMLESGQVRTDVVFSIASSMNEDGYFALSLGTDYTMTAIKKARAIVLEVNPNVPFTEGDCHIHISQVTALIEDNQPILSFPEAQFTETDIAVAKYVNDLVKDGDTLQIGFGSLPDAIAKKLAETKNDLGIHTEIIADGVMELIEKGVATGKYKTLKPGKALATFAAGSEKLYRAMHHHPSLEMHPATFVNNPFVACQNDNLVAINGAVEVDFFGQCASESMGTYLYSSTGGQLDFVRAANLSKGGRAIIVLPSTAKKGTKSRIQPVLEPGSAVSTHKNEVDYVVTEFGVAQLRGKTIRERTHELINIAHPDFKDELIEAAKARHLW